jgi:hypothetical protein
MNINIIYEYEMVLLGKKSGVSVYFFSHSPEQNERLALDIIRYAVETYLKWSPEEVYKNFNESIIKQMKLDSIMRYIRFPPEADEKSDYFIIAGKLYPDKIKINIKEMTLVIYRRVIEGKLYKFPKGFFDDSIGYYRAIVCLQYMLTQFCHFGNISDMYRDFSMSKGTKLLKNYKLQAARITMWECAIDYLHAALPESSQSEYYYHYYKFKIFNEKQKREMIDNHTFTA